MWFSHVSVAILAVAGVAQSAALQKRDLLKDLQDQAIDALKKAQSEGASCNLSNASVRRNW
jgi:tyrosinase